MMRDGKLTEWLVMCDGGGVVENDQGAGKEWEEKRGEFLNGKKKVEILKKKIAVQERKKNVRIKKKKEKLNERERKKFKRKFRLLSLI